MTQLHRHALLALAMLGFSLSAACSFESSSLGPLQCSAGDTYAGGGAQARCVDGVWVLVADMNVPTDMPVDMPVDMPIDMPPPVDMPDMMDMPLDMADMPIDMPDMADMPLDMADMADMPDMCTPPSRDTICTDAGAACGAITYTNPCTGQTEQVTCANTCATNARCEQNQCACDCTIDGQCYLSGDANPNNSCAICEPGTSTSAWSPAPVTQGCDDGSLCTEQDHCDGAGACTGTTKDCSAQDTACSEGTCAPLDGSCTTTPRMVGTSCSLPGDPACTVRACDGAGTCGEMVANGTCLINGACVANGALNPNNPCQKCDTGANTNDWTAITDGVTTCAANDACGSFVCDGGGACARNQTAGCIINNACVADGTINPMNPCQRCDGGANATGWTNITDNVTSCGATDACGGGFVCNGSAVCTYTPSGSGCAIDGMCINNATINPNNPCQKCDPGANPQGWTDITDGVTTCAANDACRSFTCDATATCAPTITSGCVINNACVAENTINPNNPCQKCAPATSNTDWTDITDGTTSCAMADACSSFVCDGSAACVRGATVAGCVINDACVADGTINPMNPCQKCDAAADNTDWTNIADNMTACAAADACGTYVCDGSATCAHVSNGTGCLINGACYADGAANPGNECQVCQAGTDAWVSAADNTPCAGDDKGCTVDVCESGACVHNVLPKNDGCTPEATDSCSGAGPADCRCEGNNPNTRSCRDR